ncbi:MAG TPA: phage portal protein [Stellaceae bacterium]|jgi:HK97 family phage portal protein|nr:phage portal protein [Stellaceae bacterium]
MPPAGGKRTPLNPSYTWGGGYGSQNDITQFRDVYAPDQGIFSPGYPLVPTDPAQVRVWDFPVGLNQIYTPRAYEPVSFAELRALADGHDITRLAIETRKDQLEKLEWSIKPRDEKNPRPDAPARIDKLIELWRFPDGDKPFATWLRESLEDVLVLDAPAFEIRRNRGGDVIGLDVVDGATIDLLIDDTGRRPRPPAPAYEQVIHGRPWKLLTTDDMLYLPRNPRPHKRYGYGPVEQIIMTVNIALRRQVQQLQHFTEGNVPPGMLSAPESWNVEQIRQFQEWFDSVLAGNTASRARLVWAPGGAKYSAFKDPPVKDEQDEWLARVVCYAFSLPPNAFTRQINRATAETVQEASLNEGQAPLMGWVKRLADHVIQRVMGHADLEFVWNVDEPLAPQDQATMIEGLVKEGLFTRNEGRDKLGMDPMPDGDVLMVDTLSGPVPLSVAANPPAPAADPQEPAAPKPGGADHDDDESGVGKTAAGTFHQGTRETGTVAAAQPRPDDRNRALLDQEARQLLRRAGARRSGPAQPVARAQESRGG